MRRAAIALGWALVAAIVWLSVTPTPPSLGIRQGDKIGHLLAYGGTMFWFAQLYTRHATRMLYAAGLIAMGIALEFVQRALGYRSFELLDMAADATGVLAGLLTALLVRFRIPSH